jgi:hypothetical protein
MNEGSEPPFQPSVTGCITANIGGSIKAMIDNRKSGFVQAIFSNQHIWISCPYSFHTFPLLIPCESKIRCCTDWGEQHLLILLGTGSHTRSPSLYKFFSLSGWSSKLPLSLKGPAFLAGPFLYGFPHVSSE